MTGDYVFQDSMPVAPLKIAALDSCKELASKVNDSILTYRENDIEEMERRQQNLIYRGYYEESYLLKFTFSRFGTGEAKVTVDDSVRGTDVFIMCDITNHSITYKVNGQINHMSPDDHFQDLKRMVSASAPTAHRVNVIMPFLYEGRQHRRSERESLDCAIALQELADLGVSNIITFDAHDPRVQNAIPLIGFDNFMPTYQFIQALFDSKAGIMFDKDHLMVISPDEGAMSKAVYLANNLGVDMGTFYKRRDYSRVLDGRNPIAAHEFLGSSVSGKDVIIIDDMISSGESILDTSKALKDRGAGRVIICCTFGLFTNGIDRFDEYYRKGYINYVVTTNLNYRPPELLTREWYIEADMSRYLAAIINSFNHDASLDQALSPTKRIQKLMEQYHSDGYEYFGSIF